MSVDGGWRGQHDAAAADEAAVRLLAQQPAEPATRKADHRTITAAGRKQRTPVVAKGDRRLVKLWIHHARRRRPRRRCKRRTRRHRRLDHPHRPRSTATARRGAHPLTLRARQHARHRAAAQRPHRRRALLLLAHGDSGTSPTPSRSWILSWHEHRHESAPLRARRSSASRSVALATRRYGFWSRQGRPRRRAFAATSGSGDDRRVPRGAAANTAQARACGVRSSGWRRDRSVRAERSDPPRVTRPWRRFCVSREARPANSSMRLPEGSSMST